MDHLAAGHGQQNLALQAAAVERRILGLGQQIVGVQHERRVHIAQHQVRRGAGGQASGVEAQKVGGGVCGRADQIRQGDAALVVQGEKAGSKVSSPTAPGVASSNGRRLSSGGAGAWAETTMSTRPAAKASIRA